MIFHDTALAGAFLVEPERLSDERGFFARTWCRRELAERGLVADLSQCSVSFNPAAGTLRGLHYQAAPHEEAKLVRCTMGEIWDVIVDLRPDSPTFKRAFAATLSAENRLQLYAPPGTAHGFLTLAPGCEVFYQISAPFEPAAARGVRWDDPAFGIRWPAEPRVISERDRGYPDFEG